MRTRTIRRARERRGGAPTWLQQMIDAQMFDGIESPPIPFGRPVKSDPYLCRIAQIVASTGLSSSDRPLALLLIGATASA